MQTIVSVSGGKSSAYVAANYPFNHLVFALVRTENKKCLYPDPKIRQLVEDRIQAPFIGTLEDDIIIKTMLDLEQYLGHHIQWVTGITYDEVLRSKGRYLPNKFRRYCTTHLKIEPIFYWWAENIGEPVNMNIGYRANEFQRVQTKMDQVNKDGLLTFKATFEKHTTGRHKGNNKWEIVPWQKPCFPMFMDNIISYDVSDFWKEKPVEFAPLNNCVGCFHRNPLLLNKMFELHPNKMEWFLNQELSKRDIRNDATWRQDVTYEQIKNNKIPDISILDFSECDSGYCNL
jgi:hypothetical protein